MTAEKNRPLPPKNEGENGDKMDTINFRPQDVKKEMIRAAMKVTGLSKSDLMNLLLDELPTVVEKLQSEKREREERISKFLPKREPRKE